MHARKKRGPHRSQIDPFGGSFHRFRPKGLLEAAQALAEGGLAQPELFRCSPHVAVLGGHVGILISTIAPIVDHVPTGKLRALAVTSHARSGVLKDVPTMMESGLPDFEMTGAMGFFHRRRHRRRRSTG